MKRYFTGLLIIGAFGLGLVGCDDAQEVGCEFFEGANCWKAGVAEANECVDTSTDTGALSGDRATCVYPDGTTITFAEPIPTDTQQDYVWNFEITSGGSSCATVRELGSNGDGGLSLTTARGEFVEEIDGLDVRMTCPSGDTYKINAFDALECGFTALPGYSWSGGGGFVTFSLLGTDANETLFECDAATP